MHKTIKFIVETFAKIYLWRFKPTIIAITGNAGKTSTKEAIGAVVGSIRKVRLSSGNLNDEVGVPFNIISSSGGEYIERGGGLLFGIKEFFKALFGLFDSSYPEVLILEYGADRPGDIQKLSEKYKPKIGVVTTVGDVPVHVEYFKNADQVAEEKSNIVKVLGTSDYTILNHDDHRVLNMKSKTKAHIVTYGFDDGSTIKASGFEYLSNEEGEPLGVTFKLHQGSSFVPVKINGSLGKSQAYAAAAAAAVGFVLGMNLVQVSEALSNYHCPKGRLKILKGIKNTNIIDDTYNASPASTYLALETLNDLPALRKVAVLGDMLELGSHTISAHQGIGDFAATFVDILVCVGPKAKLIAEAATKHMSPDKIFKFDTSDEAKQKVQELIREHDLILVKGSQGARMEKIVEEIMAEPQNKRSLLIRQSPRWLLK